MDALVWAVYARLDDYPPGPHLAPLASYYETDATGRKQMQLARQIAGVLDDYQVYRPDMLLNWEKVAPSSIRKTPRKSGSPGCGAKSCPRPGQHPCLW